MNNTQSELETQANPTAGSPTSGNPTSVSRRQLLGTGMGLAAAAALLPAVPASAQNPARPAPAASPNSEVVGRRRLGLLEVSSIGMGVQNMHRKYTTEVPYRPEMVNILRRAFEHGVTFFDTAEAYGPFENERILGEASSRSETRSESLPSSGGISTPRPVREAQVSTASRNTSNAPSRDR